MARKTLKRKMSSQIRALKNIVTTQHSLAGITINFELQRMQAISMAHGVMSTLISVKNSFDVESEAYKEVEKLAQVRIGQCVTALIGTGMSTDEANQRILQGH